MKPLLFALVLATVGAVVYHTGQKLVPQTAHPMAVLMAAYAVAFSLSALALPWMQPTGAAAPWRQEEAFSLPKALGMLMVMGGLALLTRR